MSSLRAIAPREVLPAAVDETVVGRSWNHHSDARWEAMKSRIVQLFIDENKSADQLVAALEEDPENSFVTSRRQLFVQLEKWGIRKKKKRPRDGGSEKGALTAKSTIEPGLLPSDGSSATRIPVLMNGDPISQLTDPPPTPRATTGWPPRPNFSDYVYGTGQVGGLETVVDTNKDDDDPEYTSPQMKTFIDSFDSLFQEIEDDPPPGRPPWLPFPDPRFVDLPPVRIARLVDPPPEEEAKSLVPCDFGACLLGAIVNEEPLSIYQEYQTPCHSSWSWTITRDDDFLGPLDDLKMGGGEESALADTASSKPKLTPRILLRLDAELMIQIRERMRRFRAHFINQCDKLKECLRSGTTQENMSWLADQLPAPLDVWGYAMMTMRRLTHLKSPTDAQGALSFLLVSRVIAESAEEDRDSYLSEFKDDLRNWAQAYPFVEEIAGPMWGHSDLITLDACDTRIPPGSYFWDAGLGSVQWYESVLRLRESAASVIGKAVNLFNLDDGPNSEVRSPSPPSERDRTQDDVASHVSNCSECLPPDHARKKRRKVEDREPIPQNSTTPNLDRLHDLKSRDTQFSLVAITLATGVIFALVVYFILSESIYRYRTRTPGRVQERKLTIEIHRSLFPSIPGRREPAYDAPKPKEFHVAVVKPPGKSPRSRLATSNTGTRCYLVANNGVEAVHPAGRVEARYHRSEEHI